VIEFFWQNRVQAVGQLYCGGKEIDMGGRLKKMFALKGGIEKKDKICQRKKIHWGKISRGSGATAKEKGVDRD